MGHFLWLVWRANSPGPAGMALLRWLWSVCVGFGHADAAVVKYAWYGRRNLIYEAVTFGWLIQAYSPVGKIWERT